MRKRDYKAEYAKRVEKARRQGYTGYGQQRYQTAKMRALREKVDKDVRELIDQFGGETVTFEEVAPQRLDKLNMLKERGANAEELQRLYDTAKSKDSRFWAEWRATYERMNTV
jgi:hypothetical protein